MKNSIFIIIFTIISFGILCFSCEKKKETAIEDFWYINNSSMAVSITYYYDGLENSVTILRGDSIIQTQITPDINRNIIINADSAILVFDDSKQIFYSKNQIEEKNILKLSNYDYQKIKDMQHQYKYVLSDDDYNAAE